MIRKAILIGGTLVILLSFSCKKEELKHYYVSDAFKRWTVFNKGSYWIYKNDSTSVTDSTFVKENPKFLEIPPYSSQDNFTLEYIDMSYTSLFFATTRVRLNQGGGETFFMQVGNNEISALIASTSDNFIPYFENINENITYQLLSSDSVFYLGPQKFINVVSTMYTKNDKKWTCWFAKDVGLIKITATNTNPGFSWSLIKYRIAKLS